MPLDNLPYDTITGHLTPAETKAAEDAQNATTRDKYQAAQRSAARQYSGFTGGSGDPYLPVLTSVTPNTKAAGTGPVAISLAGSNFNEDSKVFFGAQELATVFVSSVALTATIPNSAIPTPTTTQVSVKTDSSVSATKPFTVT
jgi:hypothetical protein